MKTAVIMPSIRVPQNLRSWAELLGEGDQVIIAGNENSPHDEIEIALVTAAAKYPTVSFDYLRPSDKRCTSSWINDYIESNHTHRRNFALLEALHAGADVIITVDDDNFPATYTWVDDAKRLLAEPNSRPVVNSASGWFDPGQLCEPPTVHRGYPISQRQQPGMFTTTIPSEAHHLRIGVVAGLWLGDPDIDAMERIVNDPVIHGISSSATLAHGTWGPFDSQSTAVCRQLAPLMFMWTDVGRYDDIWCSYLMRAIMDVTGYHVTYGEPLVRQERNPHNLLRDLKDEMFGYEHTEDLCSFLRDMSEELKLKRSETPEHSNPWAMFKYVVDQLGWSCRFLPDRTILGLKAWIKDVDDLMTQV